MIGGREKAQVINYLKATALERGLLLNFGTGRLEYERLILTARYSSADRADNTDAPRAAGVDEPWLKQFEFVPDICDICVICGWLFIRPQIAQITQMRLEQQE